MVWPLSGDESAVKVNESSFPVEPAVTIVGATVIRPIPFGEVAPAADCSASAPSRAASAVMSARVVFPITDPSARKRESEVKQEARVAVGVERVEHDRDQAAVSAVRGGDETVGGKGRPTGLDAVRAAV